MSDNLKIRNDLKKIVEQIETLAYETRSKLASGASVLDTTNELAKNSMMLVFGVGQLYGVESPQVTNPTHNISRIRKPQLNFHNTRDSYGRFVRVTRP